jgi:hypothetical protein
MTACELPKRFRTVQDSHGSQILVDSLGVASAGEEFGGEYNCRARTASTATTAVAPAFVVPQKLHTQQPRVRPMREAKKWNKMEQISGIQRYTEFAEKNASCRSQQAHRLPRESLIISDPSSSQLLSVTVSRNVHEIVRIEDPRIMKQIRLEKSVVFLSIAC